MLDFCLALQHCKSLTEYQSKSATQLSFESKQVAISWKILLLAGEYLITAIGCGKGGWGGEHQNHSFRGNLRLEL